MHKLFRSLTRSSVEAGAALPYVFKSFEDNGVRFHPGDFSMFAGPPGSGKTALALNYALNAGVDTLYLSSDMPSGLVVKRLLSMKTLEDPDAIDKNLKTLEEFDRYSKVLRTVGHLYMDYPARPDAEAVAGALMELMEILGCPPDLMVVDNLMNLDSGKENEWAGLRELAQVLKFMAKDLDFHITALHHTHIGVPDLSRPVPYSNIMGKIAELPAVILTIAKRPGQLLFSPVKNRYGRADATAGIVLPLDYDERLQVITDPKPKEPLQLGITPETPNWRTYTDWRDRAYQND